MPLNGRGAVLVTDGDQRAALATARSLGAGGYRVFVCSAEPHCLAGGSRHSTAEALVPDPLAAPQPYVEAIRALVTRWNVETIVPISEPSLLALLAARDSLRATIPFPDLATFRRISDKEAVMEEARALGIAVPRQLVVHTPSDFGSDVQFPVVFKPARSVSGPEGRQVKLSAEHAADRVYLERRLAEIDPAAFPILVQERITGPGIGIFLLRWKGRTIAQFAHRRLREKPPSGGVSTYRESIAADPDMVRRSEALLDRFDWSGVAMIEYKRDAVTRTPYLMEINGRLWGSLQLAIDAGVDFPMLLLEAASHGHPAPVRDYLVGVRSRWEWGEIDHVLMRMARSGRSLSLPDDAPGRLRTLLSLGGVLRRRDHLEVWRWTDPGPFVRESRAWFRALRRS